ncbi:MAG: hypothetical protein ACI9K5_000610, partial [Gammaproteobacteria bacterium]
MARFYFVNFEGGLLTGNLGNPIGSFCSYDPFPGLERLLGPTTPTGLFKTDRDGSVV